MYYWSVDRLSDCATIVARHLREAGHCLIMYFISLCYSQDKEVPWKEEMVKRGKEKDNIVGWAQTELVPRSKAVCLSVLPMYATREPNTLGGRGECRTGDEEINNLILHNTWTLNLRYEWISTSTASTSINGVIRQCSMTQVTYDHRLVCQS